MEALPAARGSLPNRAGDLVVAAVVDRRLVAGVELQSLATASTGVGRVDPWPPPTRSSPADGIAAAISFVSSCHGWGVLGFDH